MCADRSQYGIPESGALRLRHFPVLPPPTTQSMKYDTPERLPTFRQWLPVRPQIRSRFRLRPDGHPQSPDSGLVYALERARVQGGLARQALALSNDARDDGRRGRVPAGGPLVVVRPEGHSVIRVQLLPTWVQRARGRTASRSWMSQWPFPGEHTGPTSVRGDAPPSTI